MAKNNDKESMAQPLRSRRDYGMDYDSSELKVIPVEPENKINIGELDYDGKIIPIEMDEVKKKPVPPMPVEGPEIIEEDAPPASPPMDTPPPPPPAEPGTLTCPMCGNRARVRGDFSKLPEKMTCPSCSVSYPRKMIQQTGDGCLKFAALSPVMEKKFQEFLKKERGETPKEESGEKAQKPVINFLTRRDFNDKLRLLVNVAKDYTKEHPEATKLLDKIEDLRFQATFKSEDEANQARKDLINIAQKVTIPFATLVGKAIDPETTYTEVKKLADEINPEGAARRKKAAVYEKAASLLEIAKEVALLLRG